MEIGFGFDKYILLVFNVELFFVIFSEWVDGREWCNEWKGNKNSRILFWYMYYKVFY